MKRRIITALFVLLSWCASFAAPLAALAATSMQCCTGKSAACCKRTHRAGWNAAPPSCSGGCGCDSLAASPDADAAPPTGAARAECAASYHCLAAPSAAPAAAPCYLAFLYQLPPPRS